MVDMCIIVRPRGRFLKQQWNLFAPGWQFAFQKYYFCGICRRQCHYMFERDMPIYALPMQQEIKLWWQKYGQMGIQLSDWVENIVGKGEIARYEQLVLFPQCFQKLIVADVSKWVSLEKRLNTVFWKSRAVFCAKQKEVDPMKIHISAIVFYWRKDSHNLCHVTVSAPSLFVLWIVRHINRG